MNPSRCAYCGALAENPVHFSWSITDEAELGQWTGSMPLCIECSQSWCPPQVSCSETCSTDQPPAV